MTKRRAPLTFENALTRVAGVIGWAEVASICKVAERTARNWSEPDTSASISIGAAHALDLAWRNKMGEGAPFLACYQAKLDADSSDALADREELLAGAAKIARESGEAAAATIAAARIDAGDADIAIAERDIERALEADNDALAVVRARRRGMSNAGCNRGAGQARASEVAPPKVTA